MFGISYLEKEIQLKINLNLRKEEQQKISDVYKRQLIYRELEEGGYYHKEGYAYSANE